MNDPARDHAEALGALERLYHKKAVTLEEAQAAAKLITGDEAAVFPPPQPTAIAPAARRVEERAVEPPAIETSPTEGTEDAPTDLAAGGQG